MTPDTSKGLVLLALSAVFLAACGDSASTGTTDLDEVTPPWTINGDGTATDDTTGLTWELKTNDQTCDVFMPPIHCLGNRYTWSDGSLWIANGTAYTEFLNTLNTPAAYPGGNCFAGHCDWRLPTLDELMTLVGGECHETVCTRMPGPTAPGDLSFYWSSTSEPGEFQPYAWGMIFAEGLLRPPSGTAPKNVPSYVRAVRDGS